ncbi:MAG: hypothetical protein K1X92_03415 [Bacteroidia bacterium]|nr:hypothetical protein [Bacteroidia bacterium]
MRTKFVLRAKDLNKKWLKAVQALYGKQSIVITIQTEEDYDMDFEFGDDDEWWEEDDLLDEEEEEGEEEKVEAPAMEEPAVKKTRAPRKKATETDEKPE